MGKPVQAQRAEDFVQSIGVNTHIDYTGVTFNSVPLIEQELTYLGIDHIRDQQPFPSWLASYQALAKFGAKFDLFLGGPGTDFGTQLPVLLPYIDQLEDSNPGSIVSLEGPNELNGPQPVYYNGVSSDTNGSVADQIMQAINSAVKGDAKLSSIPILNASIGGSSDWYSYAQQEGNMSSYVQEANYHVYYSNGDQPENGLAYAAQMAEMTAPGEPLTFTESGYSNAVASGGVDQATQANNTLNLLADAYKLGAQQTYIYELSNELPAPSSTDYEQSFGLFNADGTAKPVATDIHDLTLILTDSVTNARTFQAGSLNYSISNLPITGNSMLLEKSSGAFDLMLWNEAPDWNATSATDIAVSPVNTTVILGSIAGTVEVFDPTLRSTPIQTLTNVSQVRVGLTDHPLIIEIEPSGAKASTSSANGTIITSASAKPIIDQAGNDWTLVQSAAEGLQIAVNGTVDPVTSNVVLLETLSGKIVQENTSGNWYSEPGAHGPWSQISPPSIIVTSSTTGIASTVSAATVGTRTVDGASFALTAPGIAKVTLGATPDKLQFIGLSSISLTGGSAAATVVADGGANTFIGSSGAITITGGIGADAYIYHKGDGMMTIKGFSLGKGDTLTVDKSLQASVTEKSDGNGGIIAGFGTTSTGFDLIGVTSITATQMHFT